MLQPEWNDLTNEALLGLIDDHHDYVWARLPFLVPMAAKIAGTCCGAGPQCTRLAQLVDRLHAITLRHLDREEAILRNVGHLGSSEMVLEEITNLRGEHRQVWRTLTQVCELAEVSEAHVDACPTVHAFYEELRALDHHLRTQMHIEDGILGPRLLAGPS